MAQPTLAQTPQVAFDSNLVDGQQVANTIRMIGFAITPQSTGYVEISVDAQNLGRAAYPLQRPDVPNSGFIMEIDTVNFSNGTRIIMANSYTAAGAPIASATRTLKFANVAAKGAIEAPAFRGSVAGEITFTGWALASGGFKRLEVYVDGLFAGLADWGLPWSDIQQLYPEYGIANGGFRGIVNLDQLGLARGFHRVSLVGIDGNEFSPLARTSRPFRQPSPG